MTTAFEEAKIQHEAGNLAEAEALYREAASNEEDSFKALNNLGTVLEDQGRYDDAVTAYKQGVELAPDCFLLHYNLGHALHRSQRLNEAFLVYLRAVQLEPESFETHYNLGNLLSEQGRFKSAVAAYSRALEFHQSTELYSNLGTAYFENKQMEEAAECYSKAIELDPNAASEHFHLGRTLEALSKFDDAIVSYERSLSLNPESSVTHAHLVMLLQKLQRDHETELAFKTWQDTIPNDPVAEHMWAAYSQEAVPTRASDSYVKAVFNEFASDFDAVLSQLNYRGPQLISSKLDELYPKKESQLAILDAGCGTGLCGPLLRPHSKNLIGVDLSIGMLEKARLRGCYDDLIECELTEYLERNSDSFDVIAAADTLIYFGEIENLCKKVAITLKPGGYFLFTVEALNSDNTSDNYTIAQHGRYAHAIEYVGLSLQRAGLDVISTDLVTIRREAAHDVKAHVVVANLANG